MPRTAASRKALRTQLQQTLHRRLGFNDFRENQERAMIAALEGFDSLMLANTGAGKSLCFVMPALVGRGMVLVVSPLIALMQNQVAGLVEKGILAAHISSSQPDSERAAILRKLLADPPELELLFITPESVKAKWFQDASKQLSVRQAVALVAVDEAHCISSWGHDFRSSYRELAKIRHMLPKVPVMALTATATDRVQKDIKTSLGLNDPVILRSSFNRPNICYSVRYHISEEDKIEDLVATIQSMTPPGALPPCMIVYARKRYTTSLIAQVLTGKGLTCEAYHAGLPARKREQVLIDWTEGRVPIVAATIAFGMGVDKANVRAVVHLTLPQSLEAFYQESGRAGRDGQPSQSIIYYSPNDVSAISFLLNKQMTRKRRRQSSAQNSNRLEAFNKVDKMASENKCRRSTVLQHFGEEVSPSPGSASCCDWCESPGTVRALWHEMTERSRTSRTQLAPHDSKGKPAEDGLDGFEFDREDNAEEEEASGEDSDDAGPAGDYADGWIARDVANQARESGADVLESLERAESVYGEAEWQGMGGSRRLLQRMGSAQDEGPATGSKQAKKALSAVVKESLREAVRAQVEKALRLNPVLSGESDSSLKALANHMEQEAFSGSMTKPVYLSKVASSKKSAATATSRSSLGGALSPPTAPSPSVDGDYQQATEAASVLGKEVGEVCKMAAQLVTAKKGEKTDVATIEADVVSRLAALEKRQLTLGLAQEARHALDRLKELKSGSAGELVAAAAKKTLKQWKLSVNNYTVK